MKSLPRFFLLSLLLTLAITRISPSIAQATTTDTILNVSYDPTREFYESYNALFASHWKKTTGRDVVVHQSHGGSGSQARAVIDGLDADVLTLGVQSDIDAVSERSRLLPANWQRRFPHESSPYASVITLLVRKGNPKHIRDWNDLAAPGVVIAAPNPKTSAGARWEFLAAYAYALKKNHGDNAKAELFLSDLYRHVETLDNGTRAATTTFTERGSADVLITWENEALRILAAPHGADYQLVAPSLSILAQPPVAVVDANVEKHGTKRVAQAYLAYLYAKPAQRLACSLGYRPTDASVSCGVRFQRVPTVTAAAFGGWKTAQKRFFGEDGVFDRISQGK